ncbi:MAG: glycosyltransferase family 39 protein [Candidatus Omnitrophota bacterium]
MSSWNKHYLRFIVLVVVLIAIALSIATYHINYWPTDSENPYLPAARKLFELPYISQIHDLFSFSSFKLTMRAKETLILGIAIMQKLLNDYDSLYPNVLLLILAVAISSLLIYFIIKEFFDEHAGLFACTLFTASFWPYLYILQGAHPPLVLMNFLAAVFFIQRSEKYKGAYFLSGIFLGLMFFSSPTSSVYFPYCLAVFIYYAIIKPNLSKENLYKAFIPAALIFTGALSIFLLFTIPRPIQNMEYFFKFIRMSQHSNNFIIYKNYLAQFFPVPLSMRGDGWEWIFRYFFLVMPIMFWAYLVSLALITIACFKNRRLIWIVLLSLSTPILVEIIQVAQFGRNYFSWFAGIIFTLSLVFHEIRTQIWALSRKYKIIFTSVVFLLLASHIIFNARVFLSDVFPSRMVTTRIYDWLMNKRTNEVYTYLAHPRYKNIVMYLNNPKHENKVYFQWIDTIAQVTKGYILIPPITGKTIWCECREEDFKADPYLTELFESGHFYDYVVATFPSLSSSPMWTQEEEICTYRDLIVKDIRDADRQKGFAWILDGKKLHDEWFSKKNLLK